MQEDLSSVKLIDRFINITESKEWYGDSISFETLLNMLSAIKEIIIEENKK